MMQGLRPILSDRGAQTVVMMTLRAETATVRRAAVVGRSSERRLTEYIMMLLMPVSCWASITAMTAMTAGRYWGSRKAPRIPMEAFAAFGLEVGWVPAEASRSVSSSSATY